MNSFQVLWAEIQKDPSQYVGIMITLIVVIVVRIWVRRYVRAQLPGRPSGVLKSIHIYPIKSCKGVSVQKWKINKYGLEHDREWMVIDSETNRFQTQRQNPKMALITPSFKEENTQQFLLVDYPGMPTLKIAMSGNTQRHEPLPQNVAVWDSTMTAVDEGDEAAAWFQKALGSSNLRFVRIPSNHARVVPPNYHTQKALNLVSFADAFPFLMISEASLSDLNERIAQKDPQISPLPMNRFRPNLVIDGVPPFAEDTFKRFQIGPITFFGAKKCTRCKLTTVDQSTGSFAGQEPLQTLRTFRQGLLQGGDEVCFGENLNHAGLGEIQVGQSLMLFEVMNEGK